MVAAVGSYLHARSRNGRWLVRIEDIDPPREVPGAARSQLETLADFGMRIDGPVTWQSRCREFHDRALETLLTDGSAFHCGCTRRDLPDSGLYPGTCRSGLPPGRQARSIRARVEDAEIRFSDGIQGPCSSNLAQQTGDFVIRRADGLVAYQLAVTVDDARAGVTEIVRGADLLDSTPRQIHLQRLLKLETPQYLHLPMVTGPDGRKLSKSEAADPVASQPPGRVLRQVLGLLGHAPPPGSDRLDRLWAWGIENWRPGRVPRGPVGVHER